MYNNDEVGQFGNPETKLKQLTLKLQQAENENYNIKNELQNEKRKVAIMQKKVPSGLANQLSDLFTEIGKVSFGNFE